MADETKISWCDRTMNFWIGCAKTSPGCANCYAQVDTFARTQRSRGRELWGPKADRHRTSRANWRKPLAWNEQQWVECISCGWRGKWDRSYDEDDSCPDCSAQHLNGEPILKATRQRVFVSSLSDICEDHPQILPEWRAEIASMVISCANLDWLFLTKRPENFNRLWQQWFDFYLPTGSTGSLPQNLWVGTTAENQEAADKRVPELMRINAKTRFLSCEPLLGHIGFNASAELRAGFEKINWLIAGGESGSKARPMHPAWARSLRDQCAEAAIPFHFKQLGEWGTDPRAGHSTATLVCNGEPMFKIGKKNTGHLLDGKEYLEFPRI